MPHDWRTFINQEVDKIRPVQPDEFTVQDVAKSAGKYKKAEKMVAEWLLAGRVTRRRVGNMYVYKLVESVDGQGPQETIKP